MSYRFRVPVEPSNGEKRVMYFEDGKDAKFFAQSCYDAARVEFNHGTEAAPKWKVWWKDGEIVYTRPGYAVHIAYRSAKWNEAIAMLKGAKA